MSWLDQLQMASFRGVPFHVDSIDIAAGDNVVLREYPFQDLPTVFRMGEGAEEIKLSAYVIGDDYLEKRDALRQVLSGQGVLVHPTAGSIRVFVAGKYQLREAPTAEGGMARFDLSFVRAEPRRYPVGAANTGQDAIASAASAKKAAKDAFAAQWSLAKQPGWVADAALDRVRAAIESVWAPLASVSKQLGDFESTLIGNYQALRAGLTSLVATPAQLADSIASLFELPSELTNAVARQLQAAYTPFLSARERIAASFERPTTSVSTEAPVLTVRERVASIADFEVSFLPPAGSTRPAMYGTGTIATVESAARSSLKRIQAAGDRLFESLATAAWVEAAASVEIKNYDEAMELRQIANAQLTLLMSTASADVASDGLTATAWHNSMQALHTAVLADLQVRSRDLARLTTYTPESWQPVWYISHRLYGTADYADEILAMNPHIQHPLLVQPGRALRVMRRD